jgi:hypothetical protein
MERHECGVQFDSPATSTQSQVATLASSGERLLLAPWNSVLQHLTGPQLVNKFSASKIKTYAKN